MICSITGQLGLFQATMAIIIGLIIDESLLVVFNLQMSGFSEVIYLGNCKGHLYGAIQR